MAKLDVPPMDTRLRTIFRPVLAEKRLNDDALWRSDIFPLLHEYLNALGHSVRQSVTTNAHAPASKIVDEILQTLSAITESLDRSFAHAAPFTIPRVAELLLAYEESGYSLKTVVSAQKWLSALARVLSVSSTESAYNLKRYAAAPPLSTSATADKDVSGVSEEERRLQNLPSNIRFVRLSWASQTSSSPDSAAVATEETPADEPSNKRQKISSEEIEPELSPEPVISNHNSTAEQAQKFDTDSSDVLLESPSKFLDHERDQESAESNKNTSDKPQSPKHILVCVDESDTLRKDMNSSDAILLESRPGNSQDSKHSTSCKNGSIDFKEQRQKEEVSI